MDWNGACEGRPPHQRQLQCKVVWLLSKKELGEKKRYGKAKVQPEEHEESRVGMQRNWKRQESKLSADLGKEHRDDFVEGM